MTQRRLPPWSVEIMAAAAVAACCLFALGIGTSHIGWGELWPPSDIVTKVRAPRVLLAAMAGGALAVAGVTFQALLQNPLADPYVVGVSGGAALGGVLALTFQLGGPFGVTLWAFAGAVASIAFLFGIAAAHGRHDPLTLLLAGTIFNSFAAAVVTLLKTWVEQSRAQEILFWLMGSLAPQSPATLWTLGACVALGAGVLAWGHGGLNLLSLGEEEAAALGLDVRFWRLGMFLAAALLVAAVVAIAGMIAFVGLVVPHVMRLWVGADHRVLIPTCLGAGACFLVLADALARACFLLLGTEVPVGAITACTGGPFFLFLLLKRRA